MRESFSPLEPFAFDEGSFRLSCLVTALLQLQESRIQIPLDVFLPVFSKFFKAFDVWWPFWLHRY